MVLSRLRVSLPSLTGCTMWSPELQRWAGCSPLATARKGVGSTHVQEGTEDPGLSTLSLQMGQDHLYLPGTIEH